METVLAPLIGRDQLGRGEAAEASAATVVTLADAIDAYRADLTVRQAGADYLTRLLFNLTPAMLKRPVGFIDVTELRKWRDATVKRMAPTSVNPRDSFPLQTHFPGTGFDAAAQRFIPAA